MRERIAALRKRLERLLLWRVCERMLEIEFLDRSVALAQKQISAARKRGLQTRDAEMGLGAVLGDLDSR